MICTYLRIIKLVLSCLKMETFYTYIIIQRVIVNTIGKDLHYYRFSSLRWRQFCRAFAILFSLIYKIIIWFFITLWTRILKSPLCPLKFTENLPSGGYRHQSSLQRTGQFVDRRANTTLKCHESKKDAGMISNINTMIIVCS